MVQDVKFSEFTNGNEVQTGDEVVGLRGGVNTRFSFPSDGIKDGDGNYFFKYLTVGASAVNYLTLTNSATGNAAVLSADGSDANINININPKGAGTLTLDQLNWPSADGSAGQVITTDGAGNLSFTSVTAGAGGSNGQMQYNNSGAFGGDSGFTTNGAGAWTGTISLSGQYNVDNIRIDANTISSTDTNGNVNITPDGSGFVVLDGLSYPQADGTANQHLKTNGSAVIGFTTATYADTYAASSLLYSNGANTVQGLATANSASLVTNASGVPAWTASLTDGQIVIGSTGGTPTPATLTAGAGISITNAANSITVSSTGGGYTWTEVTGTSQSMAINNGYIANNAGLVTCTLPATASVGDTITIQGKGAGLFRIAQNAGQTIHFGSSDTTTGAGGYLEATHRYDSIELLCITANTDWAVLTGTQGVFTVV